VRGCITRASKRGGAGALPTVTSRSATLSMRHMSPCNKQHINIRVDQRRAFPGSNINDRKPEIRCVVGCTGSSLLCWLGESRCG
jgi:hypothetical protein